MSTKRHTTFVASAIALALLCGAWPASATPLSTKQQQAADARARVSSQQAALQGTLRTYTDARSRLAAINAQAAKNSERLDALIARQDRLQTQLDARAVGMYRSGPLGFVEVLARSATFDQFSNTWEQLARIGRHEAGMVRDLKAMRARVARAAEDLLKQQAGASAQLRALEDAKAKARRDLSSSQASYASYQRQVASLEAQEDAERSKKARVRDKARPTEPRPRSGKAPVGSGAWGSAVCSCYGDSDIGSPMAGGGTVQADSMIVAHKTLPFGTLVEFSYHGSTGVARVADRGPYIDGREFDLGPGIARVLGFDGVATVRYRIISR